MNESTPETVPTSTGDSFATSPTASASLCSVTVSVTNLKNTNGQVCFSLFDQPKGFPGKGERAIAKGFSPADQAIYAFHDLTPGRYAIAIFHDEDSNGKLNKGLLGIPKEGFGFSNNPKILVGAPSFRAAAMDIVHPQTEIQIQLKYFS